jgi:cytochrome c1
MRTGAFSFSVLINTQAMKKSDKYVGINNDIQGGMTSIGKIIRDAWVFGLIPEDETCEGWDLGRFEALLQKVDAEWDKYSCMVSNLPAELRERHEKIHGEWIEKAKAAGWSGEAETDDEN